MDTIKIQHPESTAHWILIDSSAFNPDIHKEWKEDEESIGNDDDTLIEGQEEKPKTRRGRSNG